MTLSPLPLSPVRTAFLAAAVAIFALFPAIAQQSQRHSLPNPVLPPTPPHSRPASANRPIPFSGNSGPAESLNSASWTALGPSSLDNNNYNSPSPQLVSGRVTGIAVDPTDSSTIYVAAAGGGVWKTTDGGSTWTPLTDSQPDLAMGAIAVAPSNHLRIYAGMGEANNSVDSNHGEGVLVSSDGGSTWTLTTAGGSFSGAAIAQIAVDPTNADTAYAAVGSYPLNASYNWGIWKTTDAGAAWSNVTSIMGSLNFSAVVIDPITPTIIYAAVGDIFTGSTNGVYRSTDSGSTWSLLSNAPHGSNNLIGRIALAVSPTPTTSGSHVLYVAISQSVYGNSGLGYFLRSDNADAATPTFTNLTSGTPDFLGAENGGGQGWYDIAVNVDGNGNVYCAGVEDYGAGGAHAVITSSNLGVTWTDISTVNGFEPHTDNHAIAFDSSNNMILGNDGGIYRYNPTSPGWTDLNANLDTIQFEGIGLHPTDFGTVIGGSQDNGTELYSDNLLWTQVAGGDGGPAKISQTDGSICYQEYTNVSLERSSDGCMSWTDITSGIASNNSNFYVPYVLDPTNGDHIVLGTDYVNETTNGGVSWTHPGAPKTNGFNSSDNSLRAVALSPANGSNAEILYASNGSNLFVAQDTGAGSSWTDITPPAGGNTIVGLATDPNDATGHTALAVVGTFSSGSGGHVFETTNQGTSWTDISSSLPNQPTWSIQIATDPNKTAYVSTDAGVYSSPSPYSTWTAVGTGLPNAQGLDLQLSPTLHALAVGTHGRGAWEIETAPYVTSASSTDANGTYNSGSVIPITLTFTSAVTVTGTPQLTLNTSPAATASYVSGSGTNTLTFNYTVASGQTTSGNATGGNLDYASSGALSLNGGTIKDASGTAAQRTLYSPGAAGSLSANKSIVISNASTPPTLTSPSSSPVSGSTTFAWNPGAGSTSFELRIGTTGPGSHDIFLRDVAGTVTSETVAIPANGATLYVRLFYKMSSLWHYVDYTFTEAQSPVLTSPTSSPLSGATTFAWNPGTNSTNFELRIGTTGPGSHDIFLRDTPSTVTSETVAIPANGATLYVRLFYKMNGVWHYVDYTFTEALAPALTSPSSSPVSGSTTFAWNPGTGSSEFELRVGTTGPGSHDIFLKDVASTVTSEQVTIPANGVTIYVRLFYKMNGVWHYQDYTFTEGT